MTTIPRNIFSPFQFGVVERTKCCKFNLYIIIIIITIIIVIIIIIIIITQGR